ncbi:hypothetical protein JKP88DRAFT_205998 [Tribonema minus]|uniref:ABM domain-containing protein n=1 Tax=Tribonema minus TaxID=303371 RepID=A0A835ZDY3_9STRA|nr:hypothetical protein JKP88DRAFT_205998 [Tribonema minus]
MAMHFEEALADVQLDSEQLQASRYIASNRFKVRKNSGAKFEQRWAQRTSRLAELDGFRWFSLLRRVEGQGSDYSVEGDFGNYISLTVWEDKTAFDAWRTGEAFKEAHGGGGISDFVKLLTTAIFILDGAPKPAFYSGLIPVVGGAGQAEVGRVAGGWRTDVVADGVKHIPAEVYVELNRFQARPDARADFEKLWAATETAVAGAGDMVFTTLLRRDVPDDGYNYIAMTAWKSREAAEQWRNSSGAAVAAAATRDAAGLLAAPAKPAYYEGVLVLVDEDGP